MAIEYGNFRKSLKNLEMQHEHMMHLSPDFPPYVHDAMRESVIQRFETCYDALWKVLRRYLIESLGLVGVPNSPRPIFQIADENNLLAVGGAQWERYVQTRLDTTHDYDEGKAAKALEIMPQFISDAIRLYGALTRETWE